MNNPPPPGDNPQDRPSSSRPQHFSVKGRARGRSSGKDKESEGAPLRVSPPGRALEPRMGSLSLADSPPTIDPSGHQLTRYARGDGNGNGNGHGNGNGAPTVARPPIRNADRYDFVQSRGDNPTPKGGESGREVSLYSNYFSVKTGQDWRIYQYRVDFSPVVDDISVRRKLIQNFQKPISDGGLGKFIFDGYSLWTANKLTVGREDVITLTASIPSEPTPFTLTIKLVDELVPTDPHILILYNNIARSCLRMLRLVQMGRNYFDPSTSIEVAQFKLKLWPGFITTLRQHDAGLLYCVELTHKVIRLETVFEIMMNMRSGMQNRGLPLNQIKEALAKEICGTIVLTVYNNRTYRIDDIEWNDNPNSKFKLADGTDISFLDYYTKRYPKHPIINLKQPLLISNPKARDIRMGKTEPVKLIPELCQMTGLTEQMKSNFQLMKDLGTHLFQVPQVKLENTASFVRRLTDNAEVKSELQGWGMEISRAPLCLQGRVLKADTVQLVNTRAPPGQNKLAALNVDEKGDFTNIFRGGYHMLSSIPLNNWVIICTSRDAQGLDNLVHIMQTVARQIGFIISRQADTVLLPGAFPDAYSKTVTQVMNKHQNIQMVFVVLPNQRLDSYAAVKKKCYLEYGVPSQCMLAKNVVSRSVKTIATKMVIQMNAKLGGECWNVHIPLQKLMIVGFDVHHGGGGPGSIGAMVATTTASFASFYSTVSFFKSREELSVNMSADMGKCIKAYRKMNGGALPNRIVFYRDGVGEGQLSFVYNTEVEAMKSRLQEVYAAEGKDEPMFSIIVCSKRINTRIMLKTGQNKCENPFPGTVVDSQITLPERWDFFLISPMARQGTVSPTSYNVLFDGNNLDANKMQRLTFKLCHLYFNWSGTVAVPAVVQYAHKLAYLTGLALGTRANEGLSHLLYYL